MRTSKVFCLFCLCVLVPACANEVHAWRSAESKNDIEAYEGFLKEYPEAKFAILAENNIRFLKAKKYSIGLIANLKATYDKLGLPYELSNPYPFSTTPPPPPPPPPSANKKGIQPKKDVSPLQPSPKIPRFSCLTLREDGILIFQDFSSKEERIPTKLHNSTDSSGRMEWDWRELKEAMISSDGKPIYLETRMILDKFDSLVKMVELLQEAGAKEIIPILTREMEPAIREETGLKVPLPIIAENVSSLFLDQDENAIAGGVDSGVEGGVVGGVLGGVVGGVLGGVVGEGDDPVRAIGEIKPPRLIKQVEPVYPEIARKAQVEGVVLLEAQTDIYGRVQTVKVKRSIPLLDQAAIDAVRQYAYEPMIIDGRPRGVIFLITVSFSLKKE